MIITSPPTDWLEGQLLSLTCKLIMPLLPEHCAHPEHTVTEAELASWTFSAHEHDRLRLVRSFPAARVIIARHASGSLVAVSTRYLVPATEA